MAGALYSLLRWFYRRHLPGRPNVVCTHCPRRLRVPQRTLFRHSISRSEQLWEWPGRLSTNVVTCARRPLFPRTNQSPTTQPREIRIDFRMAATWSTRGPSAGLWLAGFTAPALSTSRLQPPTDNLIRLFFASGGRKRGQHTPTFCNPRPIRPDIETPSQVHVDNKSASACPSEPLPAILTLL